ncbi:MAG TPA: hypothetical protein VKU60_03110, partial [Chloroflexota bacterium]|nr:hypothetical protein [Chloroflexota bacterium]
MSARERVDTGIYRRNGHFEITVWKEGERLQETLPDGYTIRQAKAYRVDRLAEVQRRGLIPPARMTVAKFLEDWLKDH